MFFAKGLEVERRDWFRTRWINEASQQGCVVFTSFHTSLRFTWVPGGEPGRRKLEHSTNVGCPPNGPNSLLQTQIDFSWGPLGPTRGWLTIHPKAQWRLTSHSCVRSWGSEAQELSDGQVLGEKYTKTAWLGCFWAWHMKKQRFQKANTATTRVLDYRIGWSKP